MGQFSQHLVVEHSTVRVDLRRAKEERLLFFEVELDVACRFESSEPLVLEGINFRDVKVSPEGYAFKYDGFRITLNMGLKVGQHTTLTVSYFVQNPCHGITFSQDNALVCCEFEPCAARYAIPCQDWPYFACSFEFHLRAAREATRLATGALIAETDHNDGSVTSIWRQEKPIAPYSASFIVGTMTRAGESYFGKASVDVETLQRTFRSEPEIRGWLESKLGPFPSEKVYHVLLDCYTALENESLIIYPASGYALTTEKDVPYFEWFTNRVICHELTHHFFGNHVRIEDWGNLWLKEGFATLLPILWAYETGGTEYGDLFLLTQWADIRSNTAKRPPCCAVKIHAEEMYDSVSYGGAAMRLMHLRGVVGDVAFWNGIRDFLTRHGGSAADGHDLQRAMERASGLSLAAWFRNWIFAGSFPKIALVVEDGSVSVRLQTAGFSFSMDLCDGSVFQFTPDCRTAQCSLIDGSILELNVTMRVPFELDVANTRIPRAVLLATLASPTVSALTKATLFQLVDEADVHSIYVLEKSWAVRAAYAVFRQKLVEKHGVRDSHPIVRQVSMARCWTTELLKERYPLLDSPMMRRSALRRISDPQFLMPFAKLQLAEAVQALGRINAKDLVLSLPRNTPMIEDALGACGQIKVLLEIFEEQKKINNVRPSVVDAILRAGDYDTILALYPTYLPDHKYLLDLPKKKKTPSLMPVKAASSSLDLTSVLFGAAVMAVILIGVSKK